MPEPKGWELFNMSFKPDEEVVVVDDDDRFWWGKLGGITDLGFTLRHGRNKVAELTWEKLRFMAHDGFPVSKIMGADGSATIEKHYSPGSGPQVAIRKALVEYCDGVQPRCKACETEDWLREPDKPVRARFGDPFDVEAAGSRIYHAGNSGLSYWSRFWNEVAGYYSEKHCKKGVADEEVLVLTSGDGARAHLWDLSTIYAFEVG